MNEVIQELIQKIGELMLEEIGEDCHKALAYAVVKEDDAMVSFMWQKAPGSTVFYQEPIPDTENDEDLFYYFYCLRNEWKLANKGHEWIAANYLVTDGDVSLDLVYPDEFDESLSYAEGRLESAKKYFGTSEVDYSLIKK